MSCSCMSDAPVKLIYSCSGVANTGLLADRTARGLLQIGLGKMTCLAAMGKELVRDVQHQMATTLLGLKETV